MPKHFDEITFHEYLDGELVGASKAIFEGHLKDCGQCRNELAALEALFAKIARAPEQAMQTDIAAPVIAALRRPAQPQLRFGWLVAVEAALAVLSSILGWPFLQREIGALDISQILGAAQLNLEVPGAGAIAASWTGLLELLEDFAVEISTYSVPIPIEGYPTLLVAALFGSAALLWLVGNRALLRSINDHEPVS
jgi:anti-sigma factor RsiW